MSTNFYWHDSPCDHCGRYEIYHVGKRSGGWSFGFQAYPGPYDNENWPFGFPVRSRVDWGRVFTDQRGYLVDENGLVELNPIDWIWSLEPPTAEQQAKEWSREMMGPHWHLDPEREWRDAEGFRFWAGDFS